MVAAIEAPDLETASHAELVVFHDQLIDLLANQGTGWSLWIDQWRREDRGYLPPSDFGGNEAARRVDEARRVLFESSPHAVYSNRVYVAFHWAPKARDVILQFLHDRDVADFATIKRAFLDACDGFLRGLGHLCPEVRILRGPALGSYLAETITYRQGPALLPEAYVNTQLGGADWQTGTELVIDGLTVKSVEVHVFGAVTPLTLEALHELPFELRWTTTLHFLDPEDQRKALENMRNMWRPKQYGFGGWMAVIATKNKSHSTERQSVAAVMDELDELEGKLQEERDGIAITTLTIRTWDKDPGQAEDNAQVIAGLLNAAGMRARVATLNAVMSTLADIPGNASRDLVNRRKAKIRLGTVSRCSPITGVSDGYRWDRHLDAAALMVAKSRRSTPLFWALHAPGSDVGHTACIGRTGSGKSALLAFMAMQHQRYEGSTVTIFDKRRSAMVATLCSDDSRWIELGGGGIGVQALRLIDDAAGMAWANSWLLSALALRQVKPSARIDAALRDGLQSLKSLHPNERTISALHGSVGDDEVRAALMHYTRSGPLGELFDGVVEGYGTSRILCIETDYVMHLEEAPLVLAACFRAIERERLVGGHPKLIMIDEAWEPLAHPLFRNRIEDLARTLRKLNGQLCLFTQSTRDLERDHTAVIMQQMSNVVFTADSRALHESNARIYRDIGLTDEQVGTVATLRPKGEYLLQTPHFTRVADITLDGDALRICGASRDADITRARALLADGVSPGKEFLAKWLGES
ncbi:hypothetical protein [Marinivivus vitaminiproducens]|uniref:hypothetical protein n=1 Tax=Marinivivus vitaminiproducens TaxID=3035935 RepID=UPI00279C6083|nr:hypothetical protein P4R82_25080 [Geminicoccaceae bacterium SCSIO 64248]